MSTQGGFGLTLKIYITSALVAVTKVSTADFPTFRKFIAESTGHDSAGGWYQAVATGKRRLEPFSAELNWDTAEATHAAMMTAFNSDAAVAMSIEDPAGDEVIAFSAHVEAITRVSQQEDRYYATVEFHPSGAPTIT
jgi:predicted secreted protein